MMTNSMPLGIETERRFLIERPDLQTLAELYGAEAREIAQTYLAAPPGYSSERVRRSIDASGTAVYTHTRKRRISQASAIEEEETIDEERYRALLLRADPERRTIEKRRVTFRWRSQCYEIDLYPFFTRTAVLETELERADAPLSFPPALVILREITGVRTLSNHALARAVPSEDSLFE
jgi:CYTH domain-containing protein